MRSSVVVALVLVGGACGSDDDNPAPAQGGGAVPPPVGGTTITQAVTRTDIVSDQPGASALDPELVNAWGLAFNPRGLAWVSATETGLSGVYDAAGRHAIPSVAIPVPSCAHSASPTGQIFNGVTGAFRGDEFIFVTEEGTVAGWRTDMGSTAALRVGATSCDGVYKGLTMARAADAMPFIFAANFRDATIDVFDGAYRRMNTAGRFVDPNMPAGFAPFNVRAVQGMLVVTYARQDADKKDDVRGSGNGFVDLFEVDGRFVSRLVSGGELDSPWGIALTPASFGQSPNRLLIGNFGDGRVHVYRLDADAGIESVRHEGMLRGADGSPLVIDGLWALEFGLNAGGFSDSALYFTAGPHDETHGIFGRLEVPGALPPVDARMLRSEIGSRRPLGK